MAVHHVAEATNTGEMHDAANRGGGCGGIHQSGLSPDWRRPRRRARSVNASVISCFRTVAVETGGYRTGWRDEEITECTCRGARNTRVRDRPGQDQVGWKRLLRKPGNQAPVCYRTNLSNEMPTREAAMKRYAVIVDG